MQTVIERFLRYVKIDTRSDHHVETHPSTSKQVDLSKLLIQELHDLGLDDIVLDENGNVSATLPSNLDHEVPVMGLLAHVDTSPDFNGKDVNPQFVENYDGGDIILNKKEHIILSPRDFPELKKYAGKTLITTDGNTLLGADDKAGVAEIMTALETFIENPKLPHGKIRIAFTTDEETGRSMDVFDIEKFSAEYAYTVDGGEIGELEYENFNAARAVVQVKGLNIHPGDAKDKLINASLVAMEFNDLLPAAQRPEYTTGYEGFFMLGEMAGNPEAAHLNYLIRDHDKTKFEHRKLIMQKAAAYMNELHGQGIVNVTIEDQYANMREKIEASFWVVEMAREAILETGITPITKPIRGGTDGARLSWQGLPTPNIFTGGMNYHGRYECIPTFAMEKVVEVLIKLAALGAKRKK